MRPRTLLLAALLTLVPGCGERPLGGSGRLVGRHLLLAGTPHEMGVWQGRLLGPRIRAFHARWQAQACGGGERGAALQEACRVYADQALRRLPERLRQELDGLAAGSGLPAEDLLLTEGLGDGLRFHAIPPRLRGHLAAAQGPRALLVPSGPDAALLADELLLVERRPAEGEPTLVVAWPGSLGGLAGASAGGLAFLAAAVPAPVTNQSLAGSPFSLYARRALERATSAEDLVERLGGATAWRLLALDGPRDRRLLGLAQVAAVVTADLSAVPVFSLPPEDEAGDVPIPARAPAPATFDALLRDASPAAWWVRWQDDAWHVGLGADAVILEPLAPGR